MQRGGTSPVHIFLELRPGRDRRTTEKGGGARSSPAVASIVGSLGTTCPMEVDSEERGPQLQGAQICSSGEDEKPPPPFLSKTYDLVDMSGAEHVVSWNEEGTAFVVWLPEELSQRLLPKYFKHCNFSSFVRQLNTYGFRKSAPDRWEFRHDKFRRGEARQLGEIVRRRCEPGGRRRELGAGAAAAASRPQLVEENRILQRENSQLLLQIARYKSLESELVKRLSQFTAGTGSR